MLSPIDAIRASLDALKSERVRCNEEIEALGAERDRITRVLPVVCERLREQEAVVAQLRSATQNYDRAIDALVAQMQ